MNAELIERGRELNFHPDFMRVRYENWVNGLNGDWLISRQRFFGVPFPLWYPVKADGTADYEHPITPSEDVLPIDPTTDVPEGYDESQRDVPGRFTAEPDIMDTWATSSLTPQIVTRWRSRARRIRRSSTPRSRWICARRARTSSAPGCSPPWTARIWRTSACRGRTPRSRAGSWTGSQEDVEVQGQRVVPNEPIDKYGADAVRYWAAAARLGLDATYDEGQMKIGRRLAIKLLNATKFALAIGRETRTIMWAPPPPPRGIRPDVTEPLDRAAMAAMAPRGARGHRVAGGVRAFQGAGGHRGPSSGSSATTTSSW